MALAALLAPAAFVLNLTAPAFVADARFLSVSFDASQIKGSDNFGFFNSSRVDALLQGLAPAYFRFSGTDIDSMTFNETRACEDGAAWGHDDGVVGSGLTLCLNASQAELLVALTSRNGLDLIMGVNGYIGKSTADPNAPWDPTNAAAFLAWLQGAVQANPQLQPPVAYEFGNEQDLWPLHGTPNTTTGATLAADVLAFRALLANFTALAGAAQFGPDTCNCWNGDDTMRNFTAALAASAPASLLDAMHLTWHFYNNPSQAMPLGMVNVSAADYLLEKISAAQVAAGEEGARLPLVIGETGECAGGGCITRQPPPQQDVFWSYAFIDGFLKLDKLGAAAAAGVSAVIGEKIFGGNDGFIQPDGFPNAPYWLQLLHKGLVGDRVLQVANSTTPGRTVRVHAHCARSTPGKRQVPTYGPGAVVLIAINFDQQQAAQIALTQASSGGAAIPLVPRDEYRLTGSMPAPLPGNDTSCVFGPQPRPMQYLPAAVCVNGQLLYLADGPAGYNTTLPFVQPVTVTDPTAPLVLPPLSQQFIVLPNAAAPACM